MTSQQPTPSAGDADPHSGGPDPIREAGLVKGLTVQMWPIARLSALAHKFDDVFITGSGSLCQGDRGGR